MGKSKDSKVTFSLLTRLFERSEVRGTDASGYWGTQPGSDGQVVYHKEPTKSSDFVHKDAWKRLRGMDLNLLIMHARAQSQGIGDSSSNKNNHPFVNEDRSVGLVHNGRIHEYDVLKKRYDTKSDCDSEILLRVFENSRNAEVSEELSKEMVAPPDVVSGVQGIRQIFSYSGDPNHSYMAVAIGERFEEGRRDLWLFHNEKRPLWVVDAREALGQVFFCSTPEIWCSALRACPEAMCLLGGRRHKIVPVPDDQIWYFTINEERPVVDDDGHGYYNFDVTGVKEFTPWDEKTPKFPILPAKRTFPVLCDLGENDEVPGKPTVPMTRHQKRHKRKNGNWSYAEHKKSLGTVWADDGTTRYADEAEDARDELVELSCDLEDDYVEQQWRDVGDGYEPSPKDDYDESSSVIGAIGKMVTANLARSLNLNSEAIERTLASGYSDGEEDLEGFDVAELGRLIAEISEKAKDIETMSINLAHDRSITPQDFQNNLESLDLILRDLKGTYLMLDSY